MNTLSSDTHPEIERLHIEMIRKTSVSRRLQMVTTGQDHDNYPGGVFVNVTRMILKEHIERFLTLLYNDNVLASKVASLLAQRKEDMK